MAALQLTVADNPLAAQAAADLLRARLSTDQTWSPAALLPVTDALARSTDASVGILALALITTAGPRAGWPSEWRALLAAFRDHPHPTIRHLALDQTTANEP
ncbi:hypothetical protein ACGFIF_01210 [Kribbella sp. NPDC049174]|uniref:hypothetical protein n=1 Tax=Kribbella sp. NPDC049174 TaxID=3364112 RepID=UPI003719D184